MMASSHILLLFFIVFFTCLYIDYAACANSRCKKIEWKALMDFKGSLVDPDDRLSLWTGRDCCSWYGITCHNHTHFVQKIYLTNDNSGKNVLGGNINSSLLKLEHLEYLDLSYNNFSWIPIPAFFGFLRSLKYLDLWQARFSGEIPQHLGNLSNLQRLSLGGFRLDSELSSKSLNWITGLSSLRGLTLSSVNLSESVDWLDSVNKLSSLLSLTINYCGLVGLPLSHDLNLTSLKSIDVRENNFNCALPPSLFNLSNLEIIWITKSNLRGPIPDMFHKLTLLEWLDLSSNSFRSSLPDSLCALTSLEYLDLGSSELQGSIPSCLGNLTNLIRLQLDHNQLSGKVPSTLGKLTKLSSLDISSNSLVGQLSESFFEGLISLQNLVISKNHLIELSVSSQWTPHFQAQTLRMDSVFIGVRTRFPAWLQTQTSLTELSLRNTSISGVIPDWCLKLDSIDLSSNFLTGFVPAFNPNATIIHLALSNNEFTGDIPGELCNLQSLAILKLDNNQLTGRIPSCLGNLRELSVLDLSNNSFFGHIPYELGYSNQLVFLRLNGNKISGKLPSSLQNLTELQTFDLGKNELHGFIPRWMGKEFMHLKYLMLHSNDFSGEISVNLCQLPSLQILNLADNSLVGTIPSCLGNLSKMVSNDSNADLEYDTLLTIIIKGIEIEYSTNLKYAKFISLSGNHLHGEIPEELMDLTELQSLNLSNNELTGKIPERIGNMKHLESLDLSRNKLFGAIPQSLAGIDGMGYLNLSFNNLSGRIPSGGHFDTFDDPSVYQGNGELCGKPTTNMCDGDSVPSKQKGLVFDGDDDSVIELEWLYAGIGPGFAFGFLEVFCILFFKSSWRYRYFKFLENVYNRL